MRLREENTSGRLVHCQTVRAL